MKPDKLFVFALASAFTLITSVAMATKDFNTTRTNWSVSDYPDNQDDCDTSGGTWLVSGENTFCHVELKVNEDGQQTKVCEAAGGTVVTENRYGVDGNFEAPDDLRDVALEDDSDDARGSGDPMKGLHIVRGKKSDDGDEYCEPTF